MVNEIETEKLMPAKGFYRVKYISKVVVTTSWDDGDPTDLKLAELLTEFGIKSTFYVATRNRERAVMEVSELRAISNYAEICAHSLTHADLRKLSNKELEKEIKGSKFALEDILGKQVQMFCYPKGKHNKRVRQAVLNAGFKGARTTKEFYLEPGDDAYQMPTTIMAFPLQSWVRLRHELRTGNYHALRVLWQKGIGLSWTEMACALFEKVLEHGGIWHLWGHSWEIEEYDLWDSLRALFEIVAHRHGVTYLTNAELVSNLDSLSTK
jgi:peptidoglycan/xylan/chitin deacetylase (PgdA/CDA1 family)